MEINIASSGTSVPLAEAIKKLELNIFAKRVVEIFSDQTTCVCTKTKSPLFDKERAQAIRDELAKSFDAILQVIDEEIKEFS